MNLILCERWYHPKLYRYYEPCHYDFCKNHSKSGFKMKLQKNSTDYKHGLYNFQTNCFNSVC